MDHVTGIGGVFFKTKDKKALLDWYQEHLGIETDKYGSKSFIWREESGEKAFSVWGPFEQESEYFDPSEQPFMVNFRVRDLDDLLSHLKSKGVEQFGKIDEYPFGRFAWILDPEGVKIELWEPTEVVPGEDQSEE
jgi:predicted enzyme related to lactoylglutathione lyase